MEVIIEINDEELKFKEFFDSYEDIRGQRAEISPFILYDKLQDYLNESDHAYIVDNNLNIKFHTLPDDLNVKVLRDYIIKGLIENAENNECSENFEFEDGCPIYLVAEYKGKVVLI